MRGREPDSYRLPDVLPPEERPSTLVMAGIWLAFLIFPLAQIVLSERGWGLIGLGLTGMAAFCCLYLFAYVVPRPVRALPFWANTLCYQLGLLACALLAAPTAGIALVTIAPFLCALWLFTHPWGTALPGVLVVVGLAVTVCLLAAHREPLVWSLLPVLFSVAIVMLVRYAIGREERMRGLRAELERSRQQEAFARDVHDVLGHSLTVISVKAQLAKRLVSRDPARAEQELADVLELTRRSLEETRAVVSRPARLSLAAQLETARQALTAAGVAAEFPEAAECAGLPAPVDALFAVCLREAVTNVLRHSRAHCVRVEVSPHRLSVVDDGVGGAAQERGSGLTGMCARARAESARVEVSDARPGDERPGTRVEVRI